MARRALLALRSLLWRTAFEAGLFDGEFLLAEAVFLHLPDTLLILHFLLFLTPLLLPKHLEVLFLNPHIAGATDQGLTALAAARFDGPNLAPPDCLLLIASAALPLARAANCLAEGDLLIYNIWKDNNY